MENAECTISRRYQNHRRRIVSRAGRGAFLETFLEGDARCPRMREDDIRTYHYAWALSRRSEAGRRRRKREKTSGRSTRPLALPSQIRRTLPVAGKIARTEESRNPGNNTIVRPHPVDAFPSCSEASRTPLQFTGTTSRAYIPGTWFRRTLPQGDPRIEFSLMLKLRVGNAERFWIKPESRCR